VAAYGPQWSHPATTEGKSITGIGDDDEVSYQRYFRPHYIQFDGSHDDGTVGRVTVTDGRGTEPV